jgi:hypothetical protein
MRSIHAFLFPTLAFPLLCAAQSTLLVHVAGGGLRSFPLSAIDSISFPNPSTAMQVHQSDGTVRSLQLSTVDSVTFPASSGVPDKATIAVPDNAAFVNQSPQLYLAPFPQASYDDESADAPTIAVALKVVDPEAYHSNWATLSILGSDAAGEGNLTYTWEVIGPVNGTVTFSANGTNAARGVGAVFNGSGDYPIRVTIRNRAGKAVCRGLIVKWLMSD